MGYVATVSYMSTTAPEDVMAMISLRVPLHLLVWLDTRARDEERTRSDLVREMLTSGRHVPEVN